MGKARMYLWEGPLIFCTHRERPGGNGKRPLILLPLIGTDQDVMGPYALVGRTIDIFILIGNNQVAMGKAHINIWEGPLTFLHPQGKTKV
jgi:hypothetical protein